MSKLLTQNSLFSRLISFTSPPSSHPGSAAPSSQAASALASRPPASRPRSCKSSRTVPRRLHPASSRRSPTWKVGPSSGWRRSRCGRNGSVRGATRAASRSRLRTRLTSTSTSSLLPTCSCTYTNICSKDPTTPPTLCTSRIRTGVWFPTKQKTTSMAAISVRLKPRGVYVASTSHARLPLSYHFLYIFPVEISLNFGDEITPNLHYPFSTGISFGRLPLRTCDMKTFMRVTSIEFQLQTVHFPMVRSSKCQVTEDPRE